MVHIPTLENPLIIPILEILQQAEEAIGEYELIGRLRPELDRCVNQLHSKQLALFQTHFLVMNALYQLQSQLVNEGFYLSISPLAIELQVIGDKLSVTAVADKTDAPLSEYYLDWAHFNKTTDEDVSSLLNGFWQFYLAQDKQAEALAVLELEAGAPWSEIQTSYRRLVASSHPDRGGSAATFMAVREAYEVLVRVYGE